MFFSIIIKSLNFDTEYSSFERDCPYNILAAVNMRLRGSYLEHTKSCGFSVIRWKKIDLFALVTVFLIPYFHRLHGSYLEHTKSCGFLVIR